MKQLVLIRHGESVWNVENRFTGWEDVDLTEHGIQEAIEAGTRLRRAGFDFDEVHTSLLKRAIRTTWLVLEAMDLLWIPMYKTWRLNERFYAALQGLNKAETAEQYGAKQVIVWRRSYDVRPPAIDREDGRFPGHDRKYRDIAPECLPVTESLADTLERLLPYWNASIRPSLEMNRKVLVVAANRSFPSRSAWTSSSSQ